jgi:hypothetical protein
MSITVLEQGRMAARLAEIRPFLDERAWRLLLGAEARAIGYGGMKAVAAAAKAKADTVSRGAHGLAAETGLEITVTHLPPGTSKWNRIEHRLFSHISLNWLNWRGRPLTSHEVIIETIGAVTTTTGLTVRAANATATTFEWRFTASDLDDPPPGLHRRPRTSVDHGGRSTSTNKRRPLAAGAG